MKYILIAAFSMAATIPSLQLNNASKQEAVTQAIFDNLKPQALWGKGSCEDPRAFLPPFCFKLR